MSCPRVLTSNDHVVQVRQQHGLLLGRQVIQVDAVDDDILHGSITLGDILDDILHGSITLGDVTRDLSLIGRGRGVGRACEGEGQEEDEGAGHGHGERGRWALAAGKREIIVNRSVKT